MNADFVLAIPPKTPTGLKATASKDRKVTLVWDRNGEADLYFYDVGRKGPGEKGFTIIVKETQPPPNVKPTFQEDKPPTAAGEYQYQVTAVRYGQSGDSNPAFLLRSAPAGPVTVKLGPGELNGVCRLDRPPVHLFNDQVNDLIGRVSRRAGRRLRCHSHRGRLPTRCFRIGFAFDVYEILVGGYLNMGVIRPNSWEKTIDLIEP